jgi:hypothetical protein
VELERDAGIRSRPGYAGLRAQKRSPSVAGASVLLAERVGFEPTVVLLLRLISSQVHSTTLPPLRVLVVNTSERV